MSKSCSQKDSLLSATNPSDSGVSSLVLYTLAVWNGHNIRISALNEWVVLAAWWWIVEFLLSNEVNLSVPFIGLQERGRWRSYQIFHLACFSRCRWWACSFGRSPISPATIVNTWVADCSGRCVYSAHLFPFHGWRLSGGSAQRWIRGFRAWCDSHRNCKYDRSCKIPCPAPLALVILPLVAACFVDITNSFILQAALNFMNS